MCVCVCVCVCVWWVGGCIHACACVWVCMHDFLLDQMSTSLRTPLFSSDPPYTQFHSHLHCKSLSSFQIYRIQTGIKHAERTAWRECFQVTLLWRLKEVTRKWRRRAVKSLVVRTYPKQLYNYTKCRESQESKMYFLVICVLVVSKRDISIHVCNHFSIITSLSLSLFLPLSISPSLPLLPFPCFLPPFLSSSTSLPPLLYSPFLNHPFTLSFFLVGFTGRFQDQKQKVN